jgi:uncharacterized protein YkwD
MPGVSHLTTRARGRSIARQFRGLSRSVLLDVPYRGERGGHTVHKLKTLGITVITALIATVLVAAVPQSATASVETSAIITKTNEYRAQNGLGALAENQAMNAVAQAWAQQMGTDNSMRHNPNYSTQIPAGWAAAGENVAAGYATPAATVDAWMGSTGHRANILSGSYNSIGTGWYIAGGRSWSVQVFAKYAGVTTPGSTSYKDATSLIYSLYSDILLRTPDAEGVNTWRNYLVNQGWPTLTVANAILYSDEYYLQRIDAAYREILGREPDAPGRADWLYRMQTRQVSVDEIRLNFTRSMEYYLNSGGTESSFVQVLYQTMLKRPAVQSDLDHWVTMSRQYGSGYVVTSIWNSYESGTIRLNTVYQGYLHRDVDSDGIRSWVPLITAQGDQAARSALVGSLEYLLMARARYPQP